MLRFTASLAAALLLAVSAHAAPVLDEVVLGDVQIHQDGSVTLIQASDGAVIHFNSFDIFAGEVVRFLQPSDQARVLNRVFGDATTIDGSLLANGIVYIVNPAGVFFNGDAVVEVGGLVAAAGNITDEDFLQGIDRFELTGPVVNTSDSVSGGQLALLGKRVENYGSIRAPDGTIALVAGDRVVLARIGGRVAVEVDGAAGPGEVGGAAGPGEVDGAAGPGEVDGAAGPGEELGIRQAGLVDAGSGQVIFAVGDHYSLAINHEGVTRGSNVELRGGDEGLVLVRGEIDAAGDANTSGGEIRVTGDRIALVGAQLDASGGAGGGSIRVGGDLRGGGALRTARRTYIDRDSELLADATERGDGGDVVVWGDEAAVVAGTISARGGAAGGDGGFAEISSLGLLEAQGEVDLGASAGSAGTLLFDPVDIVIVGGAADGSDLPDGAPPEDQVVGDGGTVGQILFGDIGDGSEPFEIFESEIEGTDANIVLEARNSITSGGSFDDDIVTVTAGNDLTLRTDNAEGDELASTTTPGIDLGALELHTSGGGSITLETGASEAAAGALADIAVGNLTTSGGGGDVTLDTANGSIRVGTIDTSGADGATGTAAGAISVFAGDLDGSGDTQIDVMGDLLARGGNGSDGDGGAGGAIEVRTEVQPGSDPAAGGGPITVAGDTDSSGGDGVGTDAAGGNAGLVRMLAFVTGAVQVGDVTAVGGTADATGSGVGGAGGPVTLGTQDGSILAGSIDSSGSDANTGTSGGAILLIAGDPDESGDTVIDVAGDLTSRGGNGTDGRGGAGGRIDVCTADVSCTGDSAGGGDVMIAGDLDSSGGAGTTGGGNAGNITVLSRVAGALALGDVTAVGGAADAGGTDRGGRGGVIDLATDDGDVVVGTTDSSGGDGGFVMQESPDPSGQGGDAGNLTIEAGAGEDGSGSLTLTGSVRAVDGDGGLALAPDTAGGVALLAQGDVEFSGVAGPQISTTESLTLRGNSVGEATQIEVDGGGTVDQQLIVRVADTADVDVSNAGFELINIQATTNEATFDVHQAAEKAGGSDVVIDINGSAGSNTIVRIDTTQVDGAPGTDTVGQEVQVEYTLEDDLEGVDDIALQTTVASGAITAAGVVNINSEDDIVLESGAIQMFEVLDPDAFSADPPVGAATGASAGLQLVADFFRDGTGAIVDGDGTGSIAAVGGGTAIDMNADGAERSGDLALLAGEGIGADGAEIVTENLEVVGLSVSTSGGVHLRNAAGGDVTLQGGFAAAEAVRVADGDADGVIGDIDIVNDAGNLLVIGDVIATGEDVTSGGDIDLGAPAGEVHFLDATGETRIEGAGNVAIDGPIILIFDGNVIAGGDVRFGDTVDSNPPSLVSRSLTVDSGGTVSFGGDVGSALSLRRLDVTGMTVLDEDRSFDLLESASFGAIDASADDVAGLTITAGDGTIFGGQVNFSGDLGANGRLQGVTVDTDRIVFDADGDQSVFAGTDGIVLNADGLAAPGPLANLGKVGGDLRLETPGAIEVGPNQTLTVDGIADLVGGVSVTVGDVNATEIHVDTPDFVVQARPESVFLVPGAGPVPSRGTELLANVITTTDAPSFEGTGLRPRFGTLSGTVGGAGAGSAQIVRLASAIDSTALVNASDPDAPVFFDLGVGVSDPGNETEPQPPEPLEQLPALPGEQAAVGSATPPHADTVQAFLDCVDAAGAVGASAPCAADATPLDSERGADVARRYVRLFGDSVEARASRDMLAGADRSERDAVLRDFASFLAQLRLLGMQQQEYETLRDRLLDSARGDKPRDALLADISAHARGIPL